MPDDALVYDGFEALLENLDSLGAWSLAEFETAMHEAVAILSGNVIERTPVGAAGRGFYSRNLRATITHQVQVSEDAIIGTTGTDVYYARDAEEGTGPHLPPWGAIEEWVFYSKNFGDVTRQEARRIAWFVSLKIAERGTRGAYMFRDGLEATQEPAFEIFDRAVDRIIERFHNGGK